MLGLSELSASIAPSAVPGPRCLCADHLADADS